MNTFLVMLSVTKTSNISKINQELFCFWWISGAVFTPNHDFHLLQDIQLFPNI